MIETTPGGAVQESAASTVPGGQVFPAGTVEAGPVDTHGLQERASGLVGLGDQHLGVVEVQG